MAAALTALAIALGLLAGYLGLGALALALGLRIALTAGWIDWGQRKKPSPADPMTINYRGDPLTALGLAFEMVAVPTELGVAEAWLVPASHPSSLWAIYVHGIGGARENGYRQLETLHRAGIPVLLISYRNDPEAPRAPDKLHSFGLTEWRDLATTVDWARGRGAEHLVLVADSMGAAIVGQYLAHAADSETIAGLAFDAPALDGPAVVRTLGSRRLVPLSGVIASLGLRLLALVGPDLRRAVCLDPVAGFAGPVLVAQGEGDPLVPAEISQRLKAQRPQTQLLLTAASVHLDSYAVAPADYRQAMLEWIGAVRSVVVAQATDGELGDDGERGDDGQEEDGGVEQIDDVHFSPPSAQG